LANNKKVSKSETRQIAVIGLGRFGRAIARELIATGHDVLGIDTNEDVVQQMSDQLTQTIQADSTSVEALRELNIQNFHRVVVSIGSQVESSILTASLLLDLGVKEVWAKANSDAHGRILRQLGIQHVVFPEDDMGKRIAHQVGGEQLDYVEIDQGFVMAKTAAAKSFAGKSLTQLGFRAKFGVLIVATSHGNSTYEAATPETVISEGDWLIVAGPSKAVDEFCELH
jgi:trk system potassium uptake protein TrkA